MHMSVQGELSPEDPLPLHMGKCFAQALLTEGKSLWFLPALPLFTREVTRAIEKKKKILPELRVAYFNNSFYMCYSIGEAYMACE
jgi:hypothetical protein